MRSGPSTQSSPPGRGSRSCRSNRRAGASSKGRSSPSPPASELALLCRPSPLSPGLAAQSERRPDRNGPASLPSSSNPPEGVRRFPGRPGRTGSILQYRHALCQLGRPHCWASAAIFRPSVTAPTRDVCAWSARASAEAPAHRVRARHPLTRSARHPLTSDAASSAAGPGSRLFPGPGQGAGGGLEHPLTCRSRGVRGFPRPGCHTAGLFDTRSS